MLTGIGGLFINNWLKRTEKVKIILVLAPYSNDSITEHVLVLIFIVSHIKLTDFCLSLKHLEQQICYEVNTLLKWKNVRSRHYETWVSLRFTGHKNWDSWCKSKLYPKILIVVIWSRCYRNRFYCSILRNIVTDQLDYRLLEKTLSLLGERSSAYYYILSNWNCQLFFSGLLTDNEMEPVAYYTNKSDKSTWEQEEKGASQTV